MDELIINSDPMTRVIGSLIKTALFFLISARSFSCGLERRKYIEPGDSSTSHCYHVWFCQSDEWREVYGMTGAFFRVGGGWMAQSAIQPPPIL